MQCKILVCFFVFLLAASSTFSSPLRVNTNILNVRDQPKGKKIGRVYRGQQFQLLEERQGWGKIQFKSGKEGWVSLDYTQTLSMSSLPPAKLKQFCQKLNQEFNRLRWHDIRCKAGQWRANYYSTQKNPLIYTVIGQGEPTSLMFCEVHADEYTPYQCFKLLALLKNQPDLLTSRLVVAPLVNPDGFLKKRKTRTNARGVDLNRNLPTSDWRILALKSWKKRYRSNKRRYPGPTANSEPENQFMVDLIQRYTPDKMVSIHAPYDFLDLDYLDGLKKNAEESKIRKKATALAMTFTKQSKSLFKNYQTFPGSLGRYGDEWKIPTYTLELPSSDYSKASRYFQRFSRSLIHSFNVALTENKIARVETPPSSELPVTKKTPAL